MMEPSTSVTTWPNISLVNGGFDDETDLKYGGGRAGTGVIKTPARGPGGVAQWSSRPPKEHKIPGSNPARV
jgi:hypothetical protein